MNLVDKIVLVTGASRGIGREIARVAGQRGARVIGTATSSAGVDNINKMFDEMQINGRAYELNLAKLDSITDFLAVLKDDNSLPDVLVNNAGITEDNLLLRMSEQSWQNVIDVDLTGAFHLIRGCLKNLLKKRWGRIINITSVVASSGNPGQANYCAAKAGLIGLTKSLAQEIGSRGITVNAVAPGYIGTDMTVELNAGQRESLMAKIPLGRTGDAEEIANVVAFLASLYSSYITGQTIHVNGGLYMA